MWSWTLDYRAGSLGGNIIHANSIMHGKTSKIHHNCKGVFKELPNPLEATRYHSLVVEQDSLPEDLEITAWTEIGPEMIDEIMGFRHTQYQMEGVQFHPESIMTEYGHTMLENFLQNT